MAHHQFAYLSSHSMCSSIFSSLVRSAQKGLRAPTLPVKRGRAGCALSPRQCLSVWFGLGCSRPAAAQELFFLIIERDIKRFMVYSYRRCSGRRNVEIDRAITARLVTGCDSHMPGETKVEVAGGVPPAGWPQARLQARDGVLGSIPETGTGCWAGTQHPPAPSPPEAHKELAVGLSVLRSTNIKRKKNPKNINFRSALRARGFYIIFLFLSSSLWIHRPGWDCNWRRAMTAVTRPGWPWSGSAASCRICIPSPKSALRGCVR